MSGARGVAEAQTRFDEVYDQYIRGGRFFEAQEYSDLTYRVYDYGRKDPSGQPRELHLEKALAVTNFNGGTIEKVPRLALPTQRGTRSLLGACKYFATERAEYAGLCDCSTNKARFELLVVLQGTGEIRWTHDIGAMGPGLLTTGGGLLFAADNAAHIMALDSKTGKTLWHTTVGANQANGAITYLLEGKQYVVAGAGDTLVAFALQ